MLQVINHFPSVSAISIVRGKEKLIIVTLYIYFFFPVALRRFYIRMERVSDSQPLISF
jgi:hypothetical protein